MAYQRANGVSCKRRLTRRGALSKGLDVRTLITQLYLLGKRDEGQTMAEYAVVLSVIAIGVFVALGVLSGAISGALNSVAAQI